MKLYTNGCSFSHGTQPEHEYNYTYEYNGFEYISPSRQRSVWTEQLGKSYKVHFNHARSGTSSDRMARTTLSFIQHLIDTQDDLSDWVFVIQATQPARKEILFNSGYFGRIHYIDEPNSAIPHFFDYAYDVANIIGDTFGNAELHDQLQQQQDKMRSDEVFTSGVKNYSLVVEEDEEIMLRHLKNLLLVVNILERYNIKYILTGMDQTCIWPDYLQTNTDVTKNLANMLPQDKIVLDIVSVIDNKVEGKNRVSPEDSHPNVYGHTMFSRYIFNELKKRNYL